MSSQIEKRLQALERVASQSGEHPAYLCADSLAELELKATGLPGRGKIKGYIGVCPDDWDKPESAVQHGPN